MSEKLPQFALGYIRGPQVAGVFLESVARALVYDAATWRIWRGRIIPQVCGHDFNVGRNAVVAEFCARFGEECPVLVMADTDHRWEPEQLMELAACCTAERPVVSALYWASDADGRQVRPVVLRRRADETLYTMWKYPADELMEVDVVGMGLCAIHAPTVLRRMQELNGEHWFDYDETSLGRFMKEDEAFCHRVQNYLGFKIHVHTGIRIGHAKSVLLVDKDERGSEARGVGASESATQITRGLVRTPTLST